MDSARWGLQDSGPLTRCPLWQVELKLTHLNWSPEATLIHFQGHYLTLCELDYHILHGEIQRAQKVRVAVDIGALCLVEDLTSARWYRGRVQSRKDNLFNVFLIDHGNILSVGAAHICSCSDDLLELPPKLVCGFLANVLLLRSCVHSVMEEYFLGLVGKNVTGYVQGLLPHKVLLLEVPDINHDLVRHGFGRHVDMDTFLLMVEMLTGMPLRHNMQPVPDLVIGRSREPEFTCDPSIWKRYKDLLSLGGPKLRCGTRVRVRVTAAIKPGLFYCQMVSKERDLQEMSKQLAELFEHSDKEHRSNLGLLCAVKGKEGNWCRGFLPFLPVNSQVRVIFVDYGFFETVKVESVHWLPPNFCSTPIMALPCSLSSQRDQEKELRAEQLGLLRGGLLGDVLLMEVNSFDDVQHQYSVTLNEVKDDQKEELEHIQKLPVAAVESVSQSKKISRHMSCLYQEDAMSKALRKTVGAEDLRINSVFVGFIQHAHNPSDFWIRTLKRNEEFEAMMAEMTDHFREVKLDEDVLLNPEPGTLCCAMYEKDMHFYRAVVTDILEHGAEVLFIDFGNTEKVPYMLIKRMPAAFANKAAFAVYCSLANVFSSGDVWTSATCDFFRNAVCNKSLKVRVVNMGTYKVGVELTVLDSGGRWDVADLLISSKKDECFSKRLKVLKMTNEPPKRQSQQASVTPDIRRSVEQWEERAGEESTTEVEVQVSSSFKASRIKPGCEFPVRCSLINSPSEFWCQTLHQAPALEELMDEVQKFYSTHTIPLRADASCCIAKSPQDGRWYRAVISGHWNHVATALLVDYGHTIQVEERHLQGITPEFLHVEAQAFRCRLYDKMNPVEDCWDQKRCNLLKDFVTSSASDLKCRVLSQVNVLNRGVYNVVELYNARNQQSAADALIDEGLARSDTPSEQLSTMIPETFVYSSFDLSPGREELVYVTYVSSQWEFYCHLDKNTEIITDLQENVSIRSKKMMQDKNRAAVRKLCLAKYLDGNWYRALVRPASRPTYLNVFYVDYGNTNVSEKSAVMCIPLDCADLLYTPMQALRCCLDSVPKAELLADPMVCLSSAVLDKPVRAVIRRKNEDGSFDVELFDGEVSVNNKVKESVQSLLTPTKKTEGTENKKKYNTSWMKWKPKCQWPGGSPSVSKLKASPKSFGPVSVRNKRTVKQQGGGTSQVVTTTEPQRNSPVKQQEQKDPNPEQPQESKKTEPAPTSSLPNRSLSAGFNAKSFVSHINSVNDFFLQLSEDGPAIEKMVEDLNSNSFRSFAQRASTVSVGDLVLAIYEEDDALYRAVVKSFEGGSSFNIEFVDYGNTAVVKMENIYSVPKEFLSQPRLSIPCSLLDKSAYGDDASFSEAVMHKALMVDLVRQRGASWEVALEMLDDDVEPNVAAEAASPQKEDAPSSSAETDETVKVSETDTPAERETEPPSPVKNCELKVPLLRISTSTKKKLVWPHRRKRTPKKSESKHKATFVRLFSVCADAFIPPNIQAKDEEKATVLSVQSNGRFYARLKRSSYLLAALERHIAANIDKCETMPREEVKEGLRCLVQVHADKWQRGVVQRVDEDSCRVFLVDHGAAREVPRHSVRQQRSDLEKIPDLAVLCKTAELESGEDEDAARRLWEDACRGALGKEVQLLFVRHSEADDLWLVEASVKEPFLHRHVQTSHQPTREDVQPAAEGQDEDSGEEPTVDTSPQELVRPPVKTNQPYFGFAAAVATPSDFRVVLEVDRWTEQDPMVADLPQVMYPCVLRGVTPVSVDGQWSEEAAVFFRQSLHQRKLHVFFRELVSNTHWKVDILAGGVHVARELVAAGHAGYVDAMLALRFQEQSAHSEEGCGQDDEGSAAARRVSEVQTTTLHNRGNRCVVA